MPFEEPPSGLRKRTPVTPPNAPSEKEQSAKQAETRVRPFGLSGILALLSIAGVLAFITLRNTSGRGADNMPDAYALCSHDRKILTVDETNPEVECLVVRDTHFVDTGSLDDVRSRWATSEATPLEVRFVEPGAIIVPGMSDAHAHILEYGATALLPLEGTKSIEETVKLVRDYVLADPDIRNNKSRFIEGWGWDHIQWSVDRSPTSDDLEQDPVLKGRPIKLQSKDGHAIWVSQKLIDDIGHIPDEIEGGSVFRDSNGKPTGILMDMAQNLIDIPEPSEEMLQKSFALTVRDALKVGLTAIHDAGFSPRSLAFFKKLAKEEALPIRIYGMLYFNKSADYWGDSVEKLIDAGNHRLNARSVKIFTDGALRSASASLYEPYSDHPETSGLSRIEPELLKEIIPKFTRDGWQVNVHAIGDRANGMVLDAFEAALKEADVRALRPRLEHAQIVAPKDLPRLGKLGLIASVQPTHAISDMWFGEDRLGPERVKGLYAFRSMIDNGARIALGSDFPVEDMNPLAGFYAAITRLSVDGKSPHGPGGWFPEQRLTREQALKGMTIDPAYASFTDHELGTIMAGKRADYVILSQNIMTIPANKILETKVLATVLDGRPVYGKI